MSNERPIKQGHWKDRLNDLDRLPDDAWTGKDVAWDTLYDRIHGKPLRRKYPWYRMAAALVLLVAGVSAALKIFHEKQASPVAAASTKPPAASLALPQNGPAGPVVPAHKADPAQPSDLARLGVPAHASAPFRLSRPSLQKAVPDANTLAGKTAAATPTADFGATASVPAGGAAPPGKKLQVISINELDNQDEGTREGGSSGSHYIQFKLLNKPFYPETATSETAYPGSGMLQVKIHR